MGSSKSEIIGDYVDEKLFWADELKQGYKLSANIGITCIDNVALSKSERAKIAKKKSEWYQIFYFRIWNLSSSKSDVYKNTNTCKQTEVPIVFVTHTKSDENYKLDTLLVNVSRKSSLKGNGKKASVASRLTHAGFSDPFLGDSKSYMQALSAKSKKNKIVHSKVVDLVLSPVKFGDVRSNEKIKLMIHPNYKDKEEDGSYALMVGFSAGSAGSAGSGSSGGSRGKGSLEEGEGQTVEISCSFQGNWAEKHDGDCTVFNDGAPVTSCEFSSFGDATPSCEMTALVEPGVLYKIRGSYGAYNQVKKIAIGSKKKYQIIFKK